MSVIIIRWLILTLAISLIPYLISGVRIDSFGSALGAAAVLAVLNALIRPILIILTLPLTIVTLGFFILVINALMFQLAGSIVPGIHISSFWSALFGSLIVSLVSWIINSAMAGETEVRTFQYRQSQRPDTIDMHRRDNGRWE